MTGRAATLHVANRLARGDRKPQHVDLEHLAPELGRCRAERGALPETGGVHQDVDAAEALAREREEADDVGLAPHVRRRDRDGGAAPAELRGECLEPVHPSRAEDDRRAGAGELARRRRADAARRAGHHRRSSDERARHAAACKSP